MRHKHNNRILGRNATTRRYLLRSLTSALLQHKSIVTTEAKAKELRRFVEPLITKAKGELTLTKRRRLLADLGHSEDLVELTKVASANNKRPGGYLRLRRLPITRHDAATMMKVDIIDVE